MSAPIENDPLDPNSGSLFSDVDVPVEPNLKDYVKTPELDHQCSEIARKLAALSSEESSDSRAGDDSSWSSDDSVPPELNPPPTKLGTSQD
ncbi:hypothetical protein EDB83DRAFT_2529802 [Lactarius deliciosus]|nr:hypothetical protein EDB83DRAFT_2529802 [Lactarius deliciosus]